jgi:hypothetical protein
MSNAERVGRNELCIRCGKPFVEDGYGGEEAASPAGTSDKPVCRHIHLIKQVGPMDGGAESTRYRCTYKECGAFLVATQLAAPQIATSAGAEATQLDQRRK